MGLSFVGCVSEKIVEGRTVPTREAPGTLDAGVVESLNDPVYIACFEEFIEDELDGEGLPRDHDISAEVLGRVAAHKDVCAGGNVVAVWGICMWLASRGADP